METKHAATTREQRAFEQLLQWVSLCAATFVAFAGMCVLILPSDGELSALHREQVPPAAYLVPAVAFTTALVLNALRLLADWGTPPAQLSLVACYIAALAAVTDYLHLSGCTPVSRDAFGQSFSVMRLALWLWTTPAMVWLLGRISDMSAKEVLYYMAADAAMILACLIGLLQPTVTGAVAGIVLSCVFFAITLQGVWKMFAAPLSMLGPGSARRTLVTLRNFTGVVWASFVVLFLAFKACRVSMAAEEWTWGFMDILGKVVFTSGLLQSNFIGMEERRQRAMKMVEEGRRLQVVEELMALVQQKENFMSCMSHELRTPLNGIIGLSDALLIGCCGALGDMAHKTVGTIKGSGLRLLSLINDILDSTSIKQGRLAIHHDCVKLHRMVDDVMDLLRPLAKKGVTLVNDIPSTMVPVAGDQGRMMQILHHLIGNACKFTTKGRVTVSAVLKVDEVEVAVSDTGIGIAPEKLDSIWEPFSQVDGTIRRAQGGTGFGLTLVRQLVQAHGGAVTLKSTVGVGTTLYLTFKAWDPSKHVATMEQVMTPGEIQVTKDRVAKMMAILKMRVGEIRKSFDRGGNNNNNNNNNNNERGTPTRLAAKAVAGTPGAARDRHRLSIDFSVARLVPRRVRSLGLMFASNGGGAFSSQEEDTTTGAEATAARGADALLLFRTQPLPAQHSSSLAGAATVVTGGSKPPPPSADVGDSGGGAATAGQDSMATATEGVSADGAGTPVPPTTRRSSKEVSRPVRDSLDLTPQRAASRLSWERTRGPAVGGRASIEESPGGPRPYTPAALVAAARAAFARQAPASPRGRPAMLRSLTAPEEAEEEGKEEGSSSADKDGEREKSGKSGGGKDGGEKEGHAERAERAEGESDSVYHSVVTAAEAAKQGAIGVEGTACDDIEGVQKEEREGQEEGGEVQAAVAAAAVVAAGGSTAGPSQPIHVLSVDDDIVNQTLIETWLTAEGMTVTRAMDGEEALAELQSMERLPDIILLDVMMPGMSGHEVCRALRDLYPTSCLPVIMLSARGKEDDVVHGLSQGANDYMVKPYGRKELLARIQAHLRYRTSAMQAAAATTSTDSDRTSVTVGEGFMDTLCQASHGFSLPGSIKSKLENSMGISSPLQAYDDLTMLVVGVSNLGALTASRQPCLPELLGSLTSLHICLEDLMAQRGAYLLDCLEDRLVIVFGLGGSTVHEQVRHALDMAEELNKLVVTLLSPPGSAGGGGAGNGGGGRLLLSAGIHCCTAMAAVVGVNHPVLHMMGALPEKAMQLQCTCPPGCIHVSRRVVEASGKAELFVQGVAPAAPHADAATFLHRSGPWAAHQAGMNQRFERYMAAHPYGPVNGGAMRLRPVQRAVLSLLRADVTWLVEVLSLGERAGRRVAPTPAQNAAPSGVTGGDGAKALEGTAPCAKPLGAGGVGGVGRGLPLAKRLPMDEDEASADDETRQAGLTMVTRLQLDKEELLRQLDRRTAESDRLLVVVDNLQLDLYGLEALQSQLDGAAMEVSALRAQLEEAHAETCHLRAQLTTCLAFWSAPPGAAFAERPSDGRGSVAAAPDAYQMVPLSAVQARPVYPPSPLEPHLSVAAAPAPPPGGGSDGPSSAQISHELDFLVNRGVTTRMTMTQLLTRLGLSDLAPAFEREDVTPDMLPYIHDTTLLQLGVTSVRDLVRLRRATQPL